MEPLTAEEEKAIDANRIQRFMHKAELCTEHDREVREFIYARVLQSLDSSEAQAATQLLSRMEIIAGIVAMWRCDTEPRKKAPRVPLEARGELSPQRRCRTAQAPGRHMPPALGPAPLEPSFTRFVIVAEKLHMSAGMSSCLGFWLLNSKLKSVTLIWLLSASNR